jgi:hypothetical protein
VINEQQIDPDGENLTVRQIVQQGSMRSNLTLTLAVDPSTGARGLRMQERVYVAEPTPLAWDTVDERAVVDRVISIELDGPILDALDEWLRRRA